MSSRKETLPVINIDVAVDSHLIGKHVKLVSGSDYGIPPLFDFDFIGKIVSVIDGHHITVSFPKLTTGHNGNGKCASGTGWFTKLENVKIIDDISNDDAAEECEYCGQTVDWCDCCPKCHAIYACSLCDYCLEKECVCTCTRCNDCFEKESECSCDDGAYTDEDEDESWYSRTKFYRYQFEHGSDEYEKGIRSLIVQDSPVRKNSMELDEIGIVPINFGVEIADFYLLQHMNVVAPFNITVAKAYNAKLDFLVEQLHKYSAMVIGGELRHAPQHVGMSNITCMFGDSHSSPMSKWFRDNSGHGRASTWWLWWKFYQKHGLQALHWAYDVFMHDTWVNDGGFGGRNWANITANVRDYEAGKLDKASFVDSCFSLEHNGGNYLNKVWVTPGKTVLDAKYMGVYTALLVIASSDVQALALSVLGIDVKSIKYTQEQEW